MTVSCETRTRERAVPPLVPGSGGGLDGREVLGGVDGREVLGGVDGPEVLGGVDGREVLGGVDGRVELPEDPGLVGGDEGARVTPRRGAV